MRFELDYVLFFSGAAAAVSDEDFVRKTENFNTAADIFEPDIFRAAVATEPGSIENRRNFLKDLATGKALADPGDEQSFDEWWSFNMEQWQKECQQTRSDLLSDFTWAAINLNENCFANEGMQVLKQTALQIGCTAEDFTQWEEKTSSRFWGSRNPVECIAFALQNPPPYALKYKSKWEWHELSIMKCAEDFDFCGKNSGYKHYRGADFIKQNYALRKISDTLHIYQDGVYVPAEDVIHGILVDVAGYTTSTQRAETYKTLKSMRTIPTIEEPAKARYIPFKSKIYDVEDERFIEYSDRFVFLRKFGIDYNPEAPEQPVIKKTIEDICCHDQELINLVYEIIGYCFYSENRFRGSAVFMVGNGNDGRSTLLNIIRSIVGAENCSSLTLQDFAERFRLIKIYGKAVNLGDDIPGSYFKDTSNFKSVVTGGVITAEQKGKDPVQFKPSTKVIFAMNAIPKAADTSEGWYSRLVFLPLNASFGKSGTCDPSLKDRQWSVEEKQYVLRMAMEGLKRILKNKGLSKCAASEEVMHRYRRTNDPVLEFVDDFEERESSIIGRSTAYVYSQYQDWCKGSGIKDGFVLSNKNFVQRITTLKGCHTDSAYDKKLKYPSPEPKKCKCFVAGAKKSA